MGRERGEREDWRKQQRLLVRNKTFLNDEYIWDKLIKCLPELVVGWWKALLLEQNITYLPTEQRKLLNFFYIILIAKCNKMYIPFSSLIISWDLFNFITNSSEAWWYTPLTAPLRKQKQMVSEIEASLVFIVISRVGKPRLHSETLS